MIIKVSQYYNFFGTNESIEEIRRLVEQAKNSGETDIILDFQGVIIHKNCYASVVKFIMESNLDIINVPQKIIELIETYTPTGRVINTPLEARAYILEEFNDGDPVMLYQHKGTKDQSQYIGIFRAIKNEFMFMVEVYSLKRLQEDGQIVKLSNVCIRYEDLANGDYFIEHLNEPLKSKFMQLYSKKA